MKQIQIIFFFLLVVTSGKAQETAKDWLLKMNKAYTEARSVSMDINILYYQLQAAPKPASNFAGTVKMAGANYYASLMGQTVVGNKNCVLVIDEEQKTVNYMKPFLAGDKKAPANVYNPSAQIDSLVRSSALTLINTTGINRRIRLQLRDHAMYEKMEVVINAADGHVEEMTYWYKKTEEAPQAAKVIVTYSQVKLNTNIPESVFSEKKYIQKKNGIWTGIGSCSGYIVNDQTKLKLPDND